MIRMWPDPCLSYPSSPYTNIETSLALDHGRQLLHVLANYKRAGIGLAAPQIGINRRVFVLDSRYLGIKAGPIFINPTIMWQSEDTEVQEEGCLSLPEDTVVEVRRAKSISLAYDTEEREGVMVELHGLAARACLHEHDHLAGVTLVNLLTRQQRRKLERLVKK